MPVAAAFFSPDGAGRSLSDLAAIDAMARPRRRLPCGARAARAAQRRCSRACASRAAHLLRD